MNDCFRFVTYCMLILYSRLLGYVRQSTEDVLNSAEEELEEQKTWLVPEEPADNFSDAKEQQDKMMVSGDLKYVFCSFISMVSLENN